LAFDPSGFITLAEELFDGSEAAQRTAISRLYYGYFLKAREYLGLQTIHDSRTHWLVVQRLRENAETIPAGVALEVLRQLQNQSDYDIEENLAADIVHLAQEQASIIQETMAGVW
jgi:hypothetical protein